MNRKEREKLCELVAAWTYPSGVVSGSELTGMAHCANAILEEFPLRGTDDYVSAMQFQMGRICEPQGFPAVLDDAWQFWQEALDDLWEEIGEDAVVDLIEDGELVERLRPAAEHIESLVIAQAGAAL